MVKKKFKNRIFLCVLTALIFGTIGVSAATYFPSNQVTYDNKTSGLKSTDVQGALDELYNACSSSGGSGGKELLNNVSIVTSGDGLYIDDIECRYFYKGTNPNNYITFNNEQAGWRIMSIECDGSIKIVRINSIGNIQWNDHYVDWPELHYSSLGEYLNGTYYNNLNATARNQIVLHTWGMGHAAKNNVSIAELVWLEKNNISGGIDNSKCYIALPSRYEFQRTSSQQTYTTDNWLNYNENWWTISAYSSDVWYIEAGGNGIYRTSPSSHEYAVRPTLYLSPSVKITGGDGSSSNPYQIQ